MADKLMPFQKNGVSDESASIENNQKINKSLKIKSVWCMNQLKSLKLIEGFIVRILFVHILKFEIK